MRTFSTIDALWHDALTHVLKDGSDLPSRDGPTKEVLGFVARLEDPRAHFLFNPVRKVSPSYTAAELLWFLSGQRTVDRIVPYAPQYTRFCNEGELMVDEIGDEVTMDDAGASTTKGKMEHKVVLYAHGAYGYRLSRRFGGYTAIANIIRMLTTDKMSRQAVLPLYDAGMDMEKATSGDKKDIPCTLALNFILRDGKLNCQGTMRSNDIWLGLPHDIYAFTSIQMLIAEALGVQVGWYQHSAMSLHLYDRNRAKAEEAVGVNNPLLYGPLTYGPHVDLTLSKVPVSRATKAAVDLERQNRTGPGLNLPGPVIGNSSLLGHAVLMAGHKWLTDKRPVLKYIESDLMRSYMESHWC